MDTLFALPERMRCDVVVGIIERLARRAATRRVVLVDQLPDYRYSSETCFLGVGSRTYADRREIEKGAAIPFHDFHETASCLGRLALESEIAWYKREWSDFIFAPLPMHARDCTFEQGQYIDLRSTYAQLLRRFGGGVLYQRKSKLRAAGGETGEYFGGLKNLGEAWAKLAYSAAVTACCPKPETGIPWWNGRAVVPRYCPPLAPCVWCVVADILHLVACRAVRDFGAVYVQIDGYIFPDVAQAGKFLGWCADMRLPARVVTTGGGSVYGLGGYRIGLKSGQSLSDFSSNLDGGIFEGHNRSWGRWLERALQWV